MKKKVFKDFDEINNLFASDLIEISFKVGQVILMFNGAYLNNDDLRILTQITQRTNAVLFSEENVLHYAIDYNEETNIPEIPSSFMEILDEIRERVCKCPILEFVVSDKYLKLYLDKKDLSVTDLLEYEDIFHFQGEGTLMLHVQRPYLLFINTDYDIGEEDD